MRTRPRREGRCCGANHLLALADLNWRNLAGQMLVLRYGEVNLWRKLTIRRCCTVNHLLPLELEEPVRLEMTECLNQLLADTITLRDLYKKSHWQVAGPTFYQLHLLFDKHLNSKRNWWMPSQSEFNCSAESA